VNTCRAKQSICVTDDACNSRPSGDDSCLTPPHLASSMKTAVLPLPVGAATTQFPPSRSMRSTACHTTSPGSTAVQQVSWVLRRARGSAGKHDTGCASQYVWHMPLSLRLISGWSLRGAAA
jgi:hypothetical protein